MLDVIAKVRLSCRTLTELSLSLCIGVMESYTRRTDQMIIAYSREPFIYIACHGVLYGTLEPTPKKSDYTQVHAREVLTDGCSPSDPATTPFKSKEEHELSLDISHLGMHWNNDLNYSDIYPTPMLSLRGNQ